MRLGLLTPEWYPDEGAGGIATYCRLLAHTAARQGHSVVVFAATRLERRPASLLGGRLLVLPVSEGNLDATQLSRRFRERVDDYLRSGSAVDVFEAAEFAGVAAEVAEAVAVPVVTRLHTPLALLLRHNEGQRIYRDDAARCDLEARQVNASALVTSPTRWLAEDAVGRWSLARTPAVIANPVEAVGAAPPRRQGPPKLLYFGRLEHRKGVLTLARAARHWLAATPHGTITLAGGDTRWHGRSMREQVAEILGTRHRARWRILPAQPHATVQTLIDQADLVVLPSLFENFAYSCVEAMSRARPVLATSGSGFEEIICPERTGYLVAPGDAPALAAAMLRCGDDRERLAVVGANAAASMSRFEAGAIVAQLCDAYSRL